MEALAQDIAQAFRSLRRSPGFIWSVIGILALGLGSVAAGFTLLNWVVLRPLPGIADPDRLGLVWTAVFSTRGGIRPSNLTYAQSQALLPRAPSAEGLAGHEGAEAINVAFGTEAPRRVNADFVAPNFLSTLGVHIGTGRDLAPDDDAPGGGREVAVIGEDLWHGMFGARPDVVGSTVRLNGVPFTVVGVAAGGFRGIERLDKTEIWLPGGAYWTVKHLRESARPPSLPYYEFVLRIRRGATFADAERQLSSALRIVATADTTDFSPAVRTTAYPGLGLPALGRGSLQHQLTLVMAIAGLMLVVVCANVANLLLLHRGRRRGETVVRMVLGATRARLIRYCLIESVLLGAAGAAGGVLLALWLVDLFRGLPVMHYFTLTGMTPDIRVLTVTVATGVAAAILAGVIPAFLGSRTDFGTDLKTSGPTMTGSAPLLRGGLAAIQVGVAIALVAGTYLFARTLRNFASVPLGFDPTGVTIFSDEPERQGYNAERAKGYRRALADRVAVIPGIERFAFVAIPPFSGTFSRVSLQPSGHGGDAQSLMATTDQVSSGYFAAMGIPLLRGSDFTADDDWGDSTAAPNKVIVSADLARKLFGTTDVVGRTLLGMEHPVPIVGVVGDIHWYSRGGKGEPMLYQPLPQAFGYPPMLVVKSGSPAGVVEREVGRAAAALDPTLPIVRWAPLAEKVTASVADRMLLFRLLTVLSVATLILAAAGIYGLVAQGVLTRTREFGIRMALGAGARDIVELAGRGAVGIIVVGVTGGILGTAYLGKFVGALLYGVTPMDPLAIAGSATALAAVAIVASLIPARRATRVDPMVALRAE